MHTEQSDRGFLHLIHPAYLPPHDLQRIISESSVVGDYDDSWDRPGSSALWVGEHHHLTREQVRELVAHMQTWLDTGRLPQPK